MAENCECLKKICKLNVIGYIAGWLGIVWRTVLVTFFSSIISNITEYDPSIYSIVLSSCLTYFIASIMVNMIFLFAIFKERRYFMLPYITIVALEMVVGVILTSGVVMLLFAINSVAFAFYVLVAALLIIGIHFILWLYNILLYKDLEVTKRRNKKNGSIARKNNLVDLEINGSEVHKITRNSI